LERGENKMNKLYNQQRQIKEISREYAVGTPSRFRDKDNWKELLIETNSHKDYLCFADIIK